MFKVEIHDNTREYFSKLDLNEDALHLTSNTSLQKLIVESNVKSKGFYSKNQENSWKVQSINELMRSLYPNLNDPIKKNYLMMELRNLLMKEKNHDIFLIQENIKELLTSYLFLIESGIRYIPEDMDNVNNEEKTIINLFNKFTRVPRLSPILREITSSEKLKNLHLILNEDNQQKPIKKIYLYNFNNLHLSRMVFLKRLSYVGYQVIFRIPYFNVSKVDEPWKNVYTLKSFNWDMSRYVQYSTNRKNAFIDYIEGLSPNKDNKNVEFKKYIGSFEFKKEIEENLDKKIRYFSLDNKFINQVFRLGDEIDSNEVNDRFKLPVVRFLTNIYKCKIRGKDIILDYNLFTDIITSGWIEIKEKTRTINGVNHMDFIQMLEPYFEGVNTIDGFIERLEELKNLKLASDNFEENAKSKINKNKVKRYLSNPFRVLSLVNLEDYNITLIQFRSLIERLRSILKRILTRDDEFINYNNTMELLKLIYEKNEFINEIKNNIKYKVAIEQINQALNYHHEEIYIHKADARDLVIILIGGAKEVNFQEEVLGMDSLDGNIQRSLYDCIHITDMSYKGYQKNIKIRKTISKYINYNFINKVLNTSEYQERKEIHECLSISKEAVNNVEGFIKFDIANIFINYSNKIIFSWIENLRDGDSESIILRILKNLYPEHENKDLILDYFEEVEKEINISHQEDFSYSNYLYKHSAISPIGYRDLDFCYNKFLYSSILQPNPIYRSDFHHKLVFSSLISLLKYDVPNYDENIKKYLFPLFPQWNYTTKENVLIINSYNLPLKEYNLYENINYPKNMANLQILRSKYIVTEKYKVKNRYKANNLDTEDLFKEFLEAYSLNDDYFNEGKHCIMCPHIMICKKGEFALEWDK
jgi:hypothetical protein